MRVSDWALLTRMKLVFWKVGKITVSTARRRLFRRKSNQGSLKGTGLCRPLPLPPSCPQERDDGIHELVHAIGL
jgi:hypothetical protein